MRENAPDCRRYAPFKAQETHVDTLGRCGRMNGAFDADGRPQTLFILRPQEWRAACNRGDSLVSVANNTPKPARAY